MADEYGREESDFCLCLLGNIFSTIYCTSCKFEKRALSGVGSLPLVTCKANKRLIYLSDHRVWLSNDRANQSSMMSYAMEYLGHGIKVTKYKKH